MREIKFRVWDNFNERMVYEPHRFTRSYETDRMESDERFNTPYIYYESWQDEDDGIRRPCFVMQFTGLHDRNGKEIYEGDIVKSKFINYAYDEIDAPNEPRYMDKVSFIEFSIEGRTFIDSTP